MKTRNKWAGGLALLLAITFLLGGCGGNNDASRSVLMAAPPQTNIDDSGSVAADSTGDEAAAADESMALVMVADVLSGAYTGDDKGAYTLASYSDGSVDVLHFDYEARTMSMLAGQPNGESRGAIGRLPGSASPLVLNGQLFLFHLGGAPALVQQHGQDGAAGLVKLNADGSEAARLPLQEGWTFALSSGVLANDAFLYFLVLDEGTGANLLVRADQNLTAFEALHQYEPGYEYSLDGFWEKGPLLVAASPLPPLSDPEFNIYWENRQFRLLAQGMNTGAVKELLEWEQGTPYCTQNNQFYHWNAEEGTLYQLDAETGAQTTLASGFAPDDYMTAQLMRTALDGRLRLQFSTSRAIRDYTVDMQTGEVAQPAHSNLGDNVAVCAEGPAGLLVRNGDRWVAKEKMPDFLAGAEASPTNPEWVKCPEYALIDAASYWAGSRSFAAITDLVYT